MPRAVFVNRIFAKNFVLSVLLLAAAMLGGWLAKNSLAHSEHASFNLPTTPDGYMTNLTYRFFDPQGQQEYQFTASRLIHYYAKDAATFEQPHLIAKNPELTWIVTADRGSSTDGNKTVYLNGNVQITRIDNKSQKTSHLTTTTMTLYPQKKYAETKDAVTITQPGTVVTAVGFSADLNTGEMRLLANTRGNYLKQP